MSIKEQLKYKFVLSLEGNDVATNLKWIMSSNSVCIMPRPKYETWFKEGTLIPNYHYIEVLDDYSNIKEIFEEYLKNEKECLSIIKNANNFVGGFLNYDQRLMISRLVVSRYQDLCN